MVVNGAQDAVRQQKARLPKEDQERDDQGNLQWVLDSYFETARIDHIKGKITDQERSEGKCWGGR